LFQIEGAAVTDPAAIGIGESAAIEKLCRQTRRVETTEGRLGVRRVREAESADPAVAPVLSHQPSKRVVAVLGLAEVFRKTASRFIAAAAVLIDDGIAVAHEVPGDRRARAGRRHSDGAL
jgi:hypothetical protein